MIGKLRLEFLIKMDEKKFLNDLEDALKIILCKPLKGSTREAMEKTVARFFRDDVSTYGSRELHEKFRTPDSAVKAFLEYIEAQDFVKKIDIH